MKEFTMVIPTYWGRAEGEEPSVALILGLIFRWVLYTADVRLAHNL
jgi:hypothetical protein